MPRACTICAHVERAAIDTALASGTAYRTIADRFGVSKTALIRHASEHIAQAVAASQAARQAVAEGAALDVVTQLAAINDAAQAILKEAREAHDGDLALKAVDRIQKQIELQAKLLGDLDERPQMNITLAPEWVTLRTVILTTLAPFADARAAVAQALARLDSERKAG